MSSVGAAATAGLNPLAHEIKEGFETAAYTAAFGPAGPLAHGIHDAVVNTVMGALPEGPAKQIIGFLLDPIGSLLTMLMPPADQQNASAGYACPKDGSHGAAGVGIKGREGATAHDPADAPVISAPPPTGPGVQRPPVGDASHKKVPHQPAAPAPQPNASCGVPPPPATTSSNAPPPPVSGATTTTPMPPPSSAELLHLQTELADSQHELTALETLQRNFTGAEMAGGLFHLPDGMLTMNDLNAIMNGPYSTELKDAAAYFMEYPDKFYRLETAGLPGRGPDGGVSMWDVMARKSQVGRDIEGLQAGIAEEKARLKEENAMPPPPRNFGQPPPPQAPAAGSTSASSATARTDSTAETSKTGSADSPKTDSTSKSEDTSTTKRTNDGVFFSGIATAIDKTYGDIEKAEANLDKLIAQDNPKASEQDIQKAQRELTKLSTRAQMLESLYSQMMQMMQNMSKLYNEIAMNAIRKIG